MWSEPVERRLVGIDYLVAVTELLQRNRRMDPTAGLYEAADLQWWWRYDRPTDHTDQLFWATPDDRLVAAAVLTRWKDRLGLTPIVLPDASPQFRAHVVRRGLAHAAQLGHPEVELEVDRNDEISLAVLADHGFESQPTSLIESWLAAEDRPPVSPLADGYRLSTRSRNRSQPHHMISELRGFPDPEPRLRQTSLYRADLDLVVYDGDDKVAGYGLFWFDPTTGTALVEPMRTEDDHQRRGIARHILTSGVELLVNLGARRIKIVSESDNEASTTLYHDVGFQPHRYTEILSGPTTPGSVGQGTGIESGAKTDGAGDG